MSNRAFTLVLLHRQSNPVLRGFSDVDWGGDLDDRKSTTTYIIFLGNNPISWRTRKQKTVACSSTEAEYQALATATSDIAWIKSFLNELGLTLCEPPLFLCDNVGATQLSLNPVMHSRMKHITIDLHFVHDFVHHGKQGWPARWFTDKTSRSVSLQFVLWQNQRCWWNAHFEGSNKGIHINHAHSWFGIHINHAHSWFGIHTNHVHLWFFLSVNISV